MDYTMHLSTYDTWDDNINFIQFNEDLTRKAVMLSKRKLLKNLANLETICSLHLLILKNICDVYSILYYPDTKELMLRLSPQQMIVTYAKRENFYELFKASKKNDS